MTELDCMDLSENKHVAAASLITQGRRTGIASCTTKDTTPLKRADVDRNMSTLFFLFKENLISWFFFTWICKKAHSRTSTKLQSRQCLVVPPTPFSPPTTTTFCPFVFLFKTHAETSAPGRAVGKSGQAAAWTCPPSSSAAWRASKGAAAWGWGVRAASRYTKTSSSPSPKPGAARWTPPRTSWEQAWSWSEEHRSFPSLGSSQGLQVACPGSRNHSLNAYPASLAAIEFPFAAMVFNPHARQVRTCWEHERGLWAVHSPPQRRLTQTRKILLQLCRTSLLLSDYTHTQQAAQFIRGREGWWWGGLGERCLHHWLPSRCWRESKSLERQSSLLSLIQKSKFVQKSSEWVKSLITQWEKLVL